MKKQICLFFHQIIFGVLITRFGLALFAAILYTSCQKNKSEDEPPVLVDPSYIEDSDSTKLSVPQLDISGYNAVQAIPSAKFLDEMPARSQGGLNACVAWTVANARIFQRHLDDGVAFSKDITTSSAYLFNRQQNPIVLTGAAMPFVLPATMITCMAVLLSLLTHGGQTLATTDMLIFLITIGKQ